MLHDRTVLVTRPVEQALELQILFENLGAKTLLQPATRIEPPQDQGALDAAVIDAARGEPQWIVFSSANGVRAVMRRLAALFQFELEIDPEAPAKLIRDAGVKIAVVGKGTARALAEFGIAPDLTPKVFNSEALLEEFQNILHGTFTQTKIYSFRADRGRRILRDSLKKLGVEFLEIEAYRSVDVENPEPRVLDAMRTGDVHYATVTSSASANALEKMFHHEKNKTKWVAISPLTADAMRLCGLEVAAVAREASTNSIVEAVCDLERSRSIRQ